MTKRSDWLDDYDVDEPLPLRLKKPFPAQKVAICLIAIVLLGIYLFSH